MFTNLTELSDNNSLQGKVALVTGSARRIGAAIVRCLHDAGATVVIHYQNSGIDAKQLQAELLEKRAGSCLLIQADLLNVAKLPSLMAHIIEHAGRLDILVNNASGFYPTPLGSITERHWDELVGTNMKVPLFLAQAAMHELQKNQGCIINMADIHGFRPLAEHAVYSAAKAGLLMLTQSLAKDLGSTVRVNGIAPGAILWPEQATVDVANAVAATGVTELVELQQAELLAKTALKRRGEADDIARAVLFLVRDAAYITGQVIPVDGGRLLHQ